MQAAVREAAGPSRMQVQAYFAVAEATFKRGANTSRSRILAPPHTILPPAAEPVKKEGCNLDRADNDKARRSRIV